jgi:hypothetical protein
MQHIPLNQRRKAQTRIEIAKAALRLFAREGYDAVSLDAVAEEAGLSADVASRGRRIDGHDPSAEASCREPERDERGAVAQRDVHRTAGPHAVATERPGGARDHVVELRVGVRGRVRRVLEDQERRRSI